MHSLPGQFKKLILDLLELLFGILTNNEINRELKPLCISLLADICLLNPEVLLEENFVENLMTILFSACEITLSHKEDEEFITKLLQAITECWTCINFGIKEITKISINLQKKFELFIPNIIICLKLFIEKLNHSETKLLISILSLMCDLMSYDSISNEMGKFINQESIRTSLVKIRNVKDEKLKNEINWVIKKINNLISNNK
jgi:hypothetical protein